jgi:glycosyltransferase involved in cell wall biosynthesis
MNVCMLSSRFYPIIGGAEQQAQRLSRRMRERGINAFVVTCRYRGLSPDESIDGIPVHRIRTIYRGMEPREKIPSLHMMAGLLGYLIRNARRIDIIHVHGAGKMAMIANAAKRLIGRPVVVKIATASTAGTGEGDLYSAETAPLGSARLFLLKASDALIATTEQIRQELLDRGAPTHRIALIPNGVDTGRLTPPTPEEKRILREKLNITGETVSLFVGRLIKRKGVDTLLRAWGDVVVEFPDAVLLVAGAGEEEETLKGAARSLGLGANVVFVGAVDPAKIGSYFKAADICIFPSRSEGMPNVLLEAMSCGVPVVASAIGGVVDVITSGENGLLVQPDDHGALAAAVKRVLAGAGTVFGEKGRKTVIEGYSLDTVTDRYIELYEALQSKRAPG